MQNINSFLQFLFISSKTERERESERLKLEELAFRMVKLSEDGDVPSVGNYNTIITWL